VLQDSKTTRRPHADVAIGRFPTTLSHLRNIAIRPGPDRRFDPIGITFPGDKLAKAGPGKQ